MPRAATCIAATSRVRSFSGSAPRCRALATTSPPARIGTATEQAPRLISSTVVA